MSVDLTRLYLDSAQTYDELRRKWLSWDDWAWMVRDTWRHPGGVQGYLDSAECTKVGRLEDWSPDLDSRNPRPDSEMIGRHPLFRHHNCWRCLNGREECKVGDPNKCDLPHAWND